MVEIGLVTSRMLAATSSAEYRQEFLAGRGGNRWAVG
jgi:hypothetical protein